MLIVEYQSLSYQRFLHDMTQIASHKTRFLITFNGALEVDLNAAVKDLTAFTNNDVQQATIISNKASKPTVEGLFDNVRKRQEILVLKNADLLFEKQTELKSAHQRESDFDLNHLFKNIAKHKGIVVLATEKMQTLSASMSTKVDVLIRFPKN